MSETLHGMITKAAASCMRSEMQEQSRAIGALVKSGVPLQSITLCSWAARDGRALGGWWLRVEAPRRESGPWQAVGCTDSDGLTCFPLRTWPCDSWKERERALLKLPVHHTYAPTCTALSATWEAGR